MKTYRSILIDDEAFCIETLKYELEKYCPEVEIVASCQDPTEAISAINVHKPDLIFLDIEMPHMNAFEMLEQIKKIDFDIIFTTAYNQFAIKAIKVSALDYLLKPIGKEDLRAAIDKLNQKQEKGVSGAGLKMLMQEMLSNQNEVVKVGLPTVDSLELVRVDHILYVEADSNYTHFHLLDGKKIIIAKTLKQAEELLRPHSFFVRVHQSYLINLNHVERYQKGSGGNVTMVNNQVLPVSKSKKDDLMNHLHSFN